MTNKQKIIMTNILIMGGIFLLIVLVVIAISINENKKIKKPKYKYEYFIGDTNMNSVTIYGDTLIMHNVYGVSSIGNETYINLDSSVRITSKLLK